MAEKHSFVHDEKFDQMFKELENDPEYLEELKKIEESERHIMDNKELHKVLLKMRNRIKMFGDLRAYCEAQDRVDGFPEGWLYTEICKFEDDMKNLVDEALKIERKSGNG